MLSFCARAKEEICANVRHKAQRRAFLAGVLLAARGLGREETVLRTTSDAFAALLPKLLAAAAPGTENEYDTLYRTRARKQPIWEFRLGGEACARLLRALKTDPQNRQAALDYYGSGALQPLAAGCFVQAGSVTDPQRGFHLEIALGDAAFALRLAQMLRGAATPIPVKTVARKNETVLYLKQNEQIGDALAYFGAPNATLELVEQQVYRSFRSKTNRGTNCDLANIDKTVEAGARQVRDIELIERKMGLSNLPEELREVARARLEEPQANLRDLGAMCSPPLSRSGVYHRLRRIAEIAEKLR